MILEGIVTTVCVDGRVNIAPMGPLVDEGLTQLVLRPYQTSTTYQNLKRTGQGVFHVTDDVWLLAQAAVGVPEPLPAMRPCEAVAGYILQDACRWYAFQVQTVDDRQARTQLVASVVAHGRQRDFVGFNRAKHAVLEAAILATRIGILPDEQIVMELQRLAVLVEKTGGEQEQRSFAFLEQHIAQRRSA